MIFDPVGTDNHVYGCIDSELIGGALGAVGDDEGLLVLDR